MSAFQNRTQTLAAGLVVTFGLWTVAFAAPGAQSPGPSSGDDAARAARSSSAPRVVLEALDGTQTVRPADAAPLTSLRGAGAAFARFLDVARDSDGEGAQAISAKDFATLELAGGDRLAGAIRGGNGDLVDLELEGGVRLQLSIDGIRSIVFAGRIPDRVTTAPTAGDDGDRLYLVAAGSLDRAIGFVEEFTVEGVTFEDQRVGSRTYEWDRVAALFINPLEEGGAEGGAGEPASGEAAAETVSVSLVGGGRLSGRLLEIGSAEEGVLLGLSGTAEVRLPGAIVSEVALDDGSFRFLSDIEPASLGSASPFGDDLGFTWPMRVDRNCQGGLLRVGGQTHARGLGVHAPSELRWDLDGTWKELRLACGVDDSGTNGTRSGSVSFRVLGDGKEIWKSEILRAGESAAQPAPLSITGVKTLVLEANPAGDFVLDRANWLRPMLVR
ncbi:NPCBM/NEW2 domain-containing protein [Saltatorellus ferox]